MFQEFEFFEKLYFHELERKQQHESNLSLPVAGIVASFSLLGFFFSHFHYSSGNFISAGMIEFGFIVSAFLSVLALVVSTSWCLRFTLGSAYEFMPGAQRLRLYYLELIKWYENQKIKNANQRASDDFRAYIIETLAKCGENNWTINLTRSQYLYRAKQSAVFALLFLGVAALFYYLDFWQNLPKLVTSP